MHNNTTCMVVNNNKKKNKNMASMHAYISPHIVPIQSQDPACLQSTRLKCLLGRAHSGVFLRQVRHVVGSKALSRGLLGVVAAGVQVVEGAGLLGVDELAEAVVLDGIGAVTLAHLHYTAIAITFSKITFIHTHTHTHTHTYIHTYIHAYIHSGAP